MTERERLIELLNDFGVTFEVKPDGDIVVKEDDCRGITKCDKITGYPCFFTRFEFDSNGNFLRMGAWE